MDDTLEMVEKYKARLQPNNEFKKVSQYNLKWIEMVNNEMRWET